MREPGIDRGTLGHADILDATAERNIWHLAGDLLDEHATSLVVVTIERRRPRGSFGGDRSGGGGATGSC